MRNYSKIILLNSLFLLSLAISCKTDKATQEIASSDVIHMLNDSLIEATILGTFAPPTGARIYAYANIAAYEAVIQGIDSMQSLAGQLNGLTAVPQADRSLYVPEVAMAMAFSEIGKDVVWHDYVLDNAAAAIVKSCRDRYPSKNISYSVDYGLQLAAAIREWMVADGYGETRKMPLYVALNEPWSWETTPPKYTEAIEPWWPTLRPVLLDSAAQFRAPPFPEFSTVEGDSFYRSAEEVYKLSDKLMLNDTSIANFWDCNPYLTRREGHVTVTVRQISPGGHWMKICQIACKKEGLGLVESTEIYTRVAIALSDGFLTSWDTKYHYNLIRPVTYINRHIDPEWEPMLETPPFPEYTSAHSVISAAASVVLDDYFGNPYPYTDDVEVPFGKQPRSFESFSQAAAEAAISRIYGGIHFREGMTEGQKQGKAVGHYLLENVHTRH